MTITEQKHFDSQGFYDWCYNITDRESRVIKTIPNPKIEKMFKDLHDKSPVKDMNIIVAHIARYKTDNLQNLNDKSRLSLILNHFSMSELKKMGEELQLTKSPIRKNQLIKSLVDLSDQPNSRDSIMRICMEYLRNEVITIRSKNKKFFKQVKDFEKNPIFDKMRGNL